MKLLSTSAVLIALSGPAFAGAAELGFAHIGLYKTGINSEFDESGIDTARLDLAAGLNVRGFRLEGSLIRDRFSDHGTSLDLDNITLSFGSNWTDNFALGYYFSKTNVSNSNINFDELGITSTLRSGDVFGKINLGGARANDDDFELVWGLEGGYAMPFGLDLTLGFVHYGDDTNVIKAGFAYEIANSGVNLEGGFMQADFGDSSDKGSSAYFGVKYNFGSKKRQFTPITNFAEVLLTTP